MPKMGEGDFSLLTADANEGFIGYQPIIEIPPYATIIAQFR
jgi:hypothetical protein